MTWEITIKHVFISEDGYRTFFRPCNDNTIDWKVRFFACFFANKKFLLCFLQDSINKYFFYPVNSVVAYPLNGSKPELPAAPKN